MEKQKIGVKMNLPYTEAVAYLEDLLKSLKAGTIVVESGGDHVTMKPGDNVVIEVEAKVKKGKQKFGLEIGWTDGAAGDLTISDTEPEPEPEKQAAPPTAPEKAAPAPEKAPAKKPAAKKTATPKTPAKPAAKKAPAAAPKA